MWGQAIGGAKKPESLGWRGPVEGPRRKPKPKAEVGPQGTVSAPGEDGHGCLALGGSGLNASPMWKLSLPSGMSLRKLTL